MQGRCRNQWRRLVGAGLAVLVGACALAGCQGSEEPGSTPSSIQAFPDPPHVDGPLEVMLHPALLRMSGDRPCRSSTDTGVLCSSDGSGGYQSLGKIGPVVITEVSTAPSDDHTSWGTTIRFAPASRDAVRRAQEQAAGFGGVVVVTGSSGVVAVIGPPDLTARRAAVLGLEKSEAWSLVDAFEKAETRSK
ncbi:hypothetical protein [Nocardioides conyzicola]|uniref:Preprotein translocase subunit SecD n=1 Tax=Nocardioides conyzicola TaxID=1651781 RepID=A0ABP8XAW0_9ACTN